MGKPGDRVSFDAFTPTGSGQKLSDQFPDPVFPPHQARYARPPYLTDAAQRERLRKEGDKQ